tara:strand:+ start:1340 stop:1810 length:471 start_codon:yes stop_codon:yes gene_type:complete
MPFLPPVFQAALTSIESNPPGTRLDFANAWADAFFNAFGTGPAAAPSLTGTAARAAAFGIFLGAYEGSEPADNPPGINTMKAGAAAFVTTLALGTLPVFASVPPTSPCPTWDQYASNGMNTTQPGIMPGLMTTATYTWLLGGIATQTTSGVVVPWA